MFQPPSIAAKERVAGNLLQQSVLAGDVMIRAGERGDTFYIVGTGALEITGKGLRTIADEGDYFGEIALLRDVPRTATVTALADSHLYVLQRDDFLAAVTGHEAARAAGRPWSRNGCHGPPEQRRRRHPKTPAGRIQATASNPAYAPATASVC